MSAGGSRSCSRCNRPLAESSKGEVCEVCLQFSGMPVSTGAAIVSSTMGPVLSPGEGEPGDLVDAQPDKNEGSREPSSRTLTLRSREETLGFEYSARSFLPEPPPGYEFLRQLGSGGMGTVYLAREYATERIVAIKFLHYPTSDSAFERFLVEVRSLSRLDHPNIIKVITVDTNWREPFLTMEYAGAGTLADLARAEVPTPPEEAARLILAAAEGVAYAHARNILHRDIKPSNILLQQAAPGEPTQNGGPARSPMASLIPKVSDFGLAKRTDCDDGLTRTGPLGTPSYMSPEAASGQYRQVGPAADVYGLGASLYHVLTGRAPFTGEDSNEIVQKVMTDQPVRPRTLRPDVPQELEAIVVKTLEKDPAARYATAAELADDLRRFLAGETPVAPLLSPVRRARRWLRRNRARLAAAIGMVLVAAGLVAAGSLLRNPAPVPPRTKVTPPDPLSLLQADLDAGKTATIIGQTGLPKYHRFWLESGSLGERESDHTCEFNALETSMLELFPKTEMEHYRVELEMRHLLSRPVDPPGTPREQGDLADKKNRPPRVDTDAVAFYFGHSYAPINASAVHAMFLVEYRDFELPEVLAPRSRSRPVNLVSTGYWSTPDIPLGRAGRTKLQGILFNPRPGNPGMLRSQPGDWRPIWIEFSPEGVHIQWKADKEKPTDPDRMVTLAQKTPDEMRRYYDQVKSSLDVKLPGAKAVLPDWSPGLPFGLLARQSKVAVRNVKVTRLP